MTERRWTESMIEERFVEAADVMKRLPDVCVPGHFNTWPRMLYEFSDLVSQEPPRIAGEAECRRDQPHGGDARLAEVAGADQRKGRLAAATGERWKTVCWKVGLHRAAARALALRALRHRVETQRAPLAEGSLKATLHRADDCGVSGCSENCLPDTFAQTERRDSLVSLARSRDASTIRFTSARTRSISRRPA